MIAVFVWTVSDAIGLGVLAIILLCILAAIAWAAWLEFVWCPLAGVWRRMFPKRTENKVTRSGPGLARLGREEGEL